jgi:hypothetical protein
MAEAANGGEIAGGCGLKVSYCELNILNRGTNELQDFLSGSDGQVKPGFQA